MATSILRKPDTPKRNPVGKVQFAIEEKDLRMILIQYLSGNEIKPYEDLIKSLETEKFICEEKIQIIKNAINVVGLLSENNLYPFVNSILSMTWMNESNELSEVYTQFIGHLLSSNVGYTIVTLEKLLESFNKVCENTDLWTEEGPSEIEIERFKRIHCTIARILNDVPLAESIFMEVAASNFPYIKRTPKEHQIFVHNLLRICEYKQNLRPNILSLIINKIIAIDVQIPRDLLEDLMDDLESDDDEMEVENIKPERDTLFEMDDVVSVTTSKMTNKSTTFELPMIDTLDLLMEQIFVFIRDIHEQDKKLGDLQNIRKLFRELFVIFDMQLLLTHGSHHVQFIMFYICSLEPNLFVEQFINSLWKKVTTPMETTISRQSAVCYIASIVARGKYVPHRLFLRVLQQLSEWCHTYIAAQQDARFDIRAHTVFYIVCQTLFYLIAFRHADLVNTNKGLLWTQSLGLGKLVNSRLNPLKTCPSGVVQNFAAVTRTYQLAYCYTVIERNNRLALPCYNVKSGDLSNNQITIFFPFDPYLLRRSSCFILNQYREYEALEQDSIEDTEDHERTMDLNNSTSSSFNKSSSFPDMFSYGTSPGFKHHL